MKIYAYGDSWTAGEGCNSDIENTLSKEDKIQYQKNNSWVSTLSKQLNCESINNGISGNSNNKIFNNVICDIQNNIITKKDLVIIMWSSSLRDPVIFFPSGEWVSWSIPHLFNESYKFLECYNSKNKKFDSFFTEYKKLFISDLFNQSYYNIVNQYYIIFLQKMLEYFEIRYIMCDAFEKMIINLNHKDDITHHINKKTYWYFKEKTFRSFLLENNQIDIWEHQDKNYNTRATQHPNLKGYSIIANEIYKFIQKNNIL